MMELNLNSELRSESEMNLEPVLAKIEAKLQAECGRLGAAIPYIPQNGHYVDMREENLSWWTNGFWAGMLWQLYHAMGNELYRKTAEYSEDAMKQAMEQYMGLHHDVGFQLLHTAVADYRLTGKPEARVMGLHGANLLAGRFNPNGNYIRAWNKDMPGWMIIDCLMNLPLLYWAGEELDDPRYGTIAELHTQTVLKSLIREDGSCHHIVVKNPATGEDLEYPAGQGYASGSSWSRGQSWAVYGLALAFRHTGKTEYLNAAKRAAHYFIANVAATGYVSLVDFRAPKEPVWYDTTATACAACGLLEIAELVGEAEKELYRSNGLRMIEALLADHCNWNPEEDGILQNGTVDYGSRTATHVPIIYGDYFLVEAVLRVLKKDFLIW